MCIAIFKPKGKEISKDILRTCHESNPDGGGFMFNQTTKTQHGYKNELQIKKGFMKFNDFWNSYKKINSINYDMLIHFRIKTHGAISKANCHPFFVSKNIGFIHNGIIDIKTKGTESDTMAFNKRILKNINDLRSVIASKGIQELIADYIGHSKLVFLDNQNRYTIINEHLGTWDNGSWFSNDSYEACNFETFTFNEGYQYEIEQPFPMCYDCNSELISDVEVENEICGDCAKEDSYYKKWFKEENKRRWF